MRSLALLVALVALGACDGGAPRPVPFEDYPAAAADATCAWVVRCRHAPDDTTCRRFLDPKSYDYRRAADAIRLGRLAYDADAAASCLAAARAAECSAPPYAHPSCARVFSGRVAAGAPCASPSECASGGCTGRVCADGCCVGTCGPIDPPPEPEPPLPLGAPCSSHLQCGDLAYCGDDWRCTALPRAAGEHCLFGCYYGDLFCHVDTETCRPYAGLDEACGPDALCNPVYAFCDGVCRPRPGVGEVCGDGDRRCVPGAICSEGLCAPRGGAGAPCASDGDCELSCDGSSSTCVGYVTCLEPR